MDILLHCMNTPYNVENLRCSQYELNSTFIKITGCAFGKQRYSKFLSFCDLTVNLIWISLQDQHIYFMLKNNNDTLKISVERGFI